MIASGDEPDQQADPDDEPAPLPELGLEKLRPALARRLASLGEPEQMAGVLWQILDACGAEELALVMAAVLEDHAAGRGQGPRRYLQAAAAMLSSERAADLGPLLASCAREIGSPRLERFLESPQAPAGDEGVRHEVPKGRDGKPLTLGERKSLARNPSRNLMERLLLDPSPDVVRNLLASAKITEAEVIRIAARRPVPGAVLAEIAASRRWSSRYRVRLALVLNPYLEPGRAIKLAALLHEQDRRRIAADPAVHPSLRRYCEQSLRSAVIEWDLKGEKCESLETDPRYH